MVKNNKYLFVTIILLFSVLPLLSADRTGLIDSLLIAYSDQDLFNGVVLVAKDNQIIYHKAFGLANREWRVPMATDTRLRIGSVSKPFTALLILQLVNEGRINLDSTIGDYLPEYGDEQKRSITIHQLLTHTSGILNSLPPEKEAIRERQFHRLEDLLPYSEQAGLYFKPGTGFHYSNFGYSILALIAERVTDTPFSQLLQENIFIPAGMSDAKQDLDAQVEKRLATGYEYNLIHGYENTTWIDNSYAAGAGGITATAEDLFRFHQSLKNNILLPAELKNKMITPTDQGSYGYGWFISSRPGKQNGDTVLVMDHSGSINGFGSYFARIPDDDIAVIVLKNSRSHNYIRPVFAPQIGKQIIEVLHDQEIQIPKKSIAMHLARVIGGQGIDLAISEYNHLREIAYQEYDFSEDELNKLGIELFFQFKMTHEALKIFALNMKKFPESYNTYDSYAFILKENGRIQEAVEYYQKGLAVLAKFPINNNSASVKKDADNARKYIAEQAQFPVQNE